MGFRNITLGLRSLRSREWGFAIPSGTGYFWLWSLKLIQVGTYFECVTHFLAFVTHLGFFHQFILICFDFSSILGGFREDFSMIVSYFFRNMPKHVEVNKTLRGRMNFKGRLLQTQTNSATKLQKNDTNLRPEKYKRKNG